MQTLLGHHWHHLPASEVAQLLDTDPEQGLDQFTLADRQKHFGPNLFSARRGRGPLVRFLLQFHHLREPRQGVKHVLFPRPGQHGAQVRTNLVGGPPRVGSLLRGGVIVDPIQKLPNLSASKLAQRNSVAPSSPFLDRGGVLLARSLSWITRTKIVRHNGIKSYRHAGTPTAAGDGSHARFLATGGTVLCFLLIEREHKTIRSGPLHWGLIGE